MKEEKLPIFNFLEQSLVSYLVQVRDIESKVTGGTRRLQGLKFRIDLRNKNSPCFVIQIGICEAYFSLKTGLKERGSCYGVERYVRDWYERPSIQSEIKNYVAMNK